MLYLSVWEDKLTGERRDEDFKNMVFAADLRDDPSLSLVNFKAIFKDELMPESPEDVEWRTPATREEMEEVLAAIAGRLPVAEEVEEHRV